MTGKPESFLILISLTDKYRDNTLTEQQLVEYVLKRVGTLYPKFTHEQQLAYALGFLAAQIKYSIDDDNKYAYRIKNSLDKLADKKPKK